MVQLEDTAIKSLVIVIAKMGGMEIPVKRVRKLYVIVLILVGNHYISNKFFCILLKDPSQHPHLKSPK